MSSKRQDYVWAAVLVAAALVVYQSSFRAGFVNWDDNRFITDNPLFQQGGWTYVRAAFTSVQMEAYHPLHLLSYLPDRWLWKDSALGFHAVNLALFAAVGVLLYRLSRRLAAPAPAGVAVLLFVLHPLCVESVVWISARKDLLAVLLFLLVLMREDRQSTARPSWLGLGLFAAAVLTKTSTVCFPLVLVAWLMFIRRVPLRTALLRSLGYFAIAAASGIGTVLVWKGHEMILVSRPTSVWIDVPATYGVYAARILLPRSLSPIYPALPAHAWAYALTFLFLGALLAFRYRGGLIHYALAAFLGALSPVSNVIPIYFRYADRYALIAMAVLVPAAAAALARVVPLATRGRQALALGGTVLVLGVLALGTQAQARAWTSSSSLWIHAVAAQPSALLARLKLAETARDTRHWGLSIEQAQAAIRLAPDNPLGYAALFFTYASRAEATGQVASKVARDWLARLGPAMAQRDAMADLLARVSASGCAPCRNTLVLLALRRWPVADEALLESARKALELEHADEALIYLSHVRDTRNARYLELQRAASSRFRPGK